MTCGCSTTTPSSSLSTITVFGGKRKNGKRYRSKKYHNRSTKTSTRTMYRKKRNHKTKGKKKKQVRKRAAVKAESPKALEQRTTKRKLSESNQPSPEEIMAQLNHRELTAVGVLARMPFSPWSSNRGLEQQTKRPRTEDPQTGQPALPPPTVFGEVNIRV